MRFRSRPPASATGTAQASGGPPRRFAHPASLTARLTHCLDELAARDDIRVTAVFGPQHGPLGDKQGNMVESPDYRDPEHGNAGIQSVWRSAPAHRRDARHLRRAAGRSAGSRLPHLHLHHDAALCAGRCCAYRQERVGARPAQSGRAGGGRHTPACRLGEFRRCRCTAHASQPHDGRAPTLVRHHVGPRRRLPRRVQFTPDLLPSDILGVSVFNPKEQSFEFYPDSYARVMQFVRGWRTEGAASASSAFVPMFPVSALASSSSRW